MGLLSCCFAPTVECLPEAPSKRASSLPPGDAQQPVLEPAVKGDNAAGALPVAAGSDWSKSWSNLNQSETTAVQQTLLKVSELIERFADGSADREAPVHALKKALQLVATDCHASYASMSMVSTDQQTFMVMGAVGSSHEATTLPNAVTVIAASDSSVDRILRTTAGGAGPAAAAPGSPAAPATAMSWSVKDGSTPPSDWLQLQKAGIKYIHAMPLRAGPEVLLGVLNLGFKHEPCLDMGSMGPNLFGTYLSLVSATLTTVVRDPGLNAYVCLARDVAAAGSLDGIMQAALLGSRNALTRMKGLGSANSTTGSHTWLRLALISGDKSAAALFDDLSQAGVRKARSVHASGGSSQWVASIQAAGGLVRTNIPMKNTIFRIALTNKKQVLIPDVQKLINQLGNVNTDLFASRLLKPPSSVLLLPLRASGIGIFGALYCLADSHTEFTEVSKQLKEVAELLGSGLIRQLTGPLAHEYLAVQQLNHELLLAREPSNESGNSFGGGTGHSSGPYSSVSPSTVTPATTTGSLPTGCSTNNGSSSLGGAARSDGSFVAAAIAGGALEFGSTMGGSWVGNGSICSTGGSFSGLGRSFMTKQMASSTNAVATGITEKLNQKRIDASMHESEEEETLAALQLIAQIGEGGFAKVFRGLYRGLVVAVKVVAVGDPSNERAVMKNAHEIAILRSSSHPNIIQAYSCITDVHIWDVVALCTRQAPPQQRAELIQALSACATPKSANNPAAQYEAAATENSTCHIQIVEYCDLGNLTTAIRNRTFNLPAPGSVSSRHSRHLSRLGSTHSAGAAVTYDSDDGSVNGAASSNGTVGSHPNTGSQGSSGQLPTFGRFQVNLRWLLLTLLEIADGMAYLHRMGVVHCDMKPANVLLRSSNTDVRGFIAKVSDFGLSRVEDDDSCATFPFNSCGTAAYVAPEALITTKKVNASVDVYAFGIMMWELFVGQHPYGNMSQQQVVEEVVLRGLRPCFPAGTPMEYAQLAASCWHATPGARPPFAEVTARLQAMLHMTQDSEVVAAASCSLTGSDPWGGQADGMATPAAAAAAAQKSSSTAVPDQNALLGNAGKQRGQKGSSGGNTGAGSDTSSVAAATSIVEAAAVWNRQHDMTDSPSVGADGSGQQPVQAQQLLQWQQQQMLQQQPASGTAPPQQQQQLWGIPPEDSAAAFRSAIPAGNDLVIQGAKSEPQSTNQQNTNAAGSVHKVQHVSFGGKAGTVGVSRLGTAQQQQRYDEMVAAVTAAVAASGGVEDAASTGTAATAGSTGHEQQQQLVRQQVSLHQQGVYMPTTGLLSDRREGQQQHSQLEKQQQQSTTTGQRRSMSSSVSAASAAAAGPGQGAVSSSAAAAMAVAKQQQQALAQQQQMANVQKAALELLRQQQQQQQLQHKSRRGNSAGSGSSGVKISSSYKSSAQQSSLQPAQ